jgi:hypothetical protein
MFHVTREFIFVSIKSTVGYTMALLNPTFRGRIHRDGLAKFSITGSNWLIVFCGRSVPVLSRPHLLLKSILQSRRRRSGRQRSSFLYYRRGLRVGDKGLLLAGLNRSSVRRQFTIQ